MTLKLALVSTFLQVSSLAPDYFVAGDSLVGVPSEALSKGMALAAKFQSMECERARDAADFAGMRLFTKKGSVQPITEQQVVVIHAPLMPEAIAPHGVDAVYVRNQKVASDMLFLDTKTYSGGFERTPRISPWRQDRGASSGFEARFVECKKNDVYFTMVRDPIETFLAGWLEVMCRDTRNMSEKDKRTAAYFPGRYVAMSLEEDPTRVFRAFLRDFEERRYLGKESFHVWPQAHKIDAVPKGCRFSFIGLASEMPEALGALFPGGHLPPHGHNATESPCKTDIMANLKIGDEETRHLCLILRVDYQCFGFPLPPACEAWEAA